MSKRYESRVGKRLGLLLFACMLFVAFGYAQNASAVVRVSAGVAFTSGGYDLLSEYGQWLSIPPYGVVWCPYADETWAPFSDGRWIWTSYGWAWDSYEPFGELVYHYGYWYYQNDIGWFWVPGDEWSPARVQWAVYGNYYGWAPLPPPSCYWPDPWDYGQVNIWIVVYANNFCDDHVGHYMVPPRSYRDIIARDRVVRRPPAVRLVEALTRRQIPVRTIVKRPMDIRTDQIQVADRSLVRRDIETRGPIPATRDAGSGRAVVPASPARTVTPRGDTGTRRVVVPESARPAAQPVKTVKPVVPVALSKDARQVVTPTKSVPVIRKVTAPGSSSQPQRQVVTPKQSAAVERTAAAPARSAQVERQAAAPARSSQAASRSEGPAKSAQPAQQSRTVEKSSSRDDKGTQRGR
jgi:hypothetical protein